MAGRRNLPHDAPLHIDPAKEIWFLTVCCKPRGLNQLARPELWSVLAESIEQRMQTGIWWIHLFVAMPDHCHFIVSFPPEGEMRKILTDWKRWLATQGGIRWQKDFFDHRLRRDESFEEKFTYVMENPVRAELIEQAEQWPYLWPPENKSAHPFTGLHRK